jgi:hypothetical protein
VCGWAEAVFVSAEEAQDWLLRQIDYKAINAIEGRL